MGGFAHTHSLRTARGRTGVGCQTRDRRATDYSVCVGLAQSGALSSKMGMGKEKLQVTTRIWLGYTYGSNCAIPDR